MRHLVVSAAALAAFVLPSIAFACEFTSKQVTAETATGGQSTITTQTQTPLPPATPKG